MELHPLVSVIIPVFNAGAFLDRCISSILSQSFLDFEVLLINDGSTDSSLCICKKHAMKDSRIRLFNRSNHGVSATRQFGIDNCCGKYCIQIDADDWIDNYCLDKLVNKAKEVDADIVYMGFVKEFPDRTETVRTYKSNNIGDYIDAMFSGKCWGSVCNKLILTNLFKSNKIKFPVNVCMWEDYVFVTKCLLFAKTIAFCEDTFYHYVQYNDNSLCSTAAKYDIPVHTIAAIADLDEFINNIGDYERYKSKLAIQKQYAKQKLLFASKYRNVQKWIFIFPESNKYFLRFLWCVIRNKIIKSH